METKKFIDGIETKIYKGKENKMIKTVGDLRKILNNLDDDYKLDIRIMKEIPEEELAGRNYPYPWEMIDGYLEFQDVGYSDKELCIGVYENKVKDIVDIIKTGGLS
jgi:hypothetical protein